VLPLHTCRVSGQELAHSKGHLRETALFSSSVPLRKIGVASLNLFNDSKLDRDRTMIWQLTIHYWDELPEPFVTVSRRARALHLVKNITYQQSLRPTVGRQCCLPRSHETPNILEKIFISRNSAGGLVLRTLSHVHLQGLMVLLVLFSIYKTALEKSTCCLMSIVGSHCIYKGDQLEGKLVVRGFFQPKRRAKLFA